ncbi:MAG: tyrosine--tRNA ligase [Chloroflexi bacterium]|nr:tyrosine--tRNA ligase [Chloroflexota bacterium]
MASVLDTLYERGFVQQISDEAGLRAELDRGGTNLYWGTDPTAPSLTVGHLVSLMMLSHFQRAGHRPIIVVGGGTGLIGDPSFRTETRQLMTAEQIDANTACLHAQIARFLDLSQGNALLLNNAEWLGRLGYIEFLRDIGWHFSVNQLLQHSTYRERLEGGSLNFIEVNYALLQAYDFLHLYREYGCALQVGGSDQWFNILAGSDLIRREEGEEAFALVTPLLTTSSGEKMGSTAEGAVWLDPARTSPYAYYQFWINTDDPDVQRYLALFTFLPMDDVRALGRLEGAELRAAKEVLAVEATTLAHGRDAAEQAQGTSRALFRGGAEAPEAAPTTVVDPGRLGAGVPLVDLLVETGLAASKRGARNLIRGGGVYVNGQRVEDVDTTVDGEDLRSGAVLLRKGPKQFHRVVPA